MSDEIRLITTSDGIPALAIVFPLDGRPFVAATTADQAAMARIALGLSAEAKMALAWALRASDVEFPEDIEAALDDELDR